MSLCSYPGDRSKIAFCKIHYAKVNPLSIVLQQIADSKIFLFWSFET
ncbi:hypothetical protein HMPREF0239_02398 [Clostridium sp. ATCC BAA-442]|nr:hypothetical protein HMPREF0239_02398 [Clostridium sp. ATCC BAA-442]